MKNYNVSDEPVTKVVVDIDDIKDTRREKSLNKECVFLMAGRMIYRKGLDLVCHGTPSPKLWKKYLDEQKDKYHSEIDDIVFRNKTYGYHSGTMRIRFKNQFVYYGSARVDPMLKSFFAEISSSGRIKKRQCCH